MDEVAESGQEIVITKHGRPVARLVPAKPVEKKPETLFGIDKGRFEIIGDIDDPIPVRWEAESGTC